AVHVAWLCRVACHFASRGARKRRAGRVEARRGRGGELRPGNGRRDRGTRPGHGAERALHLDLVRLVVFVLDLDFPGLDGVVGVAGALDLDLLAVLQVGERGRRTTVVRATVVDVLG